MQLLVLYWKQRRRGILTFALFVLIFLFTFWLYHFPLEAVFYPALLCACLGLGLFAFDLWSAYKKHRLLQNMQGLPSEMLDSFPPIQGLDDADYQALLRNLCEEQRKLAQDMNSRYADMIDYYTVWVHQIKTPIASMHLQLQNEDSPLSRKLTAELFRIEQYVEMVLMFLRLRASSTDYVIKEYDLDPILRESIKRFAGEFIGRNIRLVYTPLSLRVVTDEKWLTFVIEQVLSNALKYTKQGSISLVCKEPKTLCITDTGIGIAPEDLPRIFEKGYTGYNGRSDKKASGLGLYLCKSICQKLGHSISATSSPEQGTTISIQLEHPPWESSYDLTKL